MITKTVTTKYTDEQGFEFTFEPIEDTLKIAKTKTGFEARYLIQDNEPINPREDENLGTMICFHRRYTLGDKTELNSDMFNGWEELYNHLIKEKKAIIILPLYLYDHSSISMKVGSFQGLLPQGHAEFDSGQVGFIYCTKDDLKRIGITKNRAEKTLRAEVEIYDGYIQGNVYCIVKETYNSDKEQIDYDTCGGYFGYLEAKKALETEF
jgi:hypothetical protein